MKACCAIATGLRRHHRLCHHQVASSSGSDTGTPVYREYNPFELVRNHNYTKDKAEHDGLVAIGWHDEGIAWYGV